MSPPAPTHWRPGAHCGPREGTSPGFSVLSTGCPQSPERRFPSSPPSPTPPFTPAETRCLPIQPSAQGTWCFAQPSSAAGRGVRAPGCAWRRTLRCSARAPVPLAAPAPLASSCTMPAACLALGAPASCMGISTSPEPWLRWTPVTTGRPPGSEQGAGRVGLVLGGPRDGQRGLKCTGGGCGRVCVTCVHGAGPGTFPGPGHLIYGKTEAQDK